MYSATPLRQQPRRVGGDYRPGMPADRAGLLDPFAERDNWPDRVVDAGDPRLG
jgi:hypothetical protein